MPKEPGWYENPHHRFYWDGAKVTKSFPTKKFDPSKQKGFIQKGDWNMIEYSPTRQPWKEGSRRAPCRTEWLAGNTTVDPKILSCHLLNGHSGPCETENGTVRPSEGQTQLPIPPYDHCVAIAYDGDEVYDYLNSWETCQSMAMEGYRIIAIKDDGPMTKEAIQKMCDYERNAVADCFGEGYLK